MLGPAVFYIFNMLRSDRYLKNMPAESAGLIETMV